MVKGFSDNEVKNNTQNTQIKEKKGLAGFLKGKKFTYTLPGKKQINIFGSIVIGLNMILVLLVILYLKNQEFHDFVFNYDKKRCPKRASIRGRNRFKRLPLNSILKKFTCRECWNSFSWYCYFFACLRV